MSEPQGISAFDLDNTLVTVNSSFLFSRYLHKEGVLSFSTQIHTALLYVRHRFLGLPLEALHHAAFAALLKGRRRQDLQKHAVAFVDSNFDRILYVPAVAALRQAQERGDYTVILSSSPCFLVEIFAQKFGVDAWHASQYVVDSEGVLRAPSDILDGTVKAGILLEKAQELGAKDTAAYSDSHLDLPFLEAADSPVAVRPDRELTKICRKRGWKLI